MYNIDVIFIHSSNPRNIHIGPSLWLKQRDALMKDMERDVLRRTILELVKKGHVHYTDIEKERVQHAYASQQPTQSENNSTTTYFQTVMWSALVEASTRSLQKGKNR